MLFPKAYGVLFVYIPINSLKRRAPQYGWNAWLKVSLSGSVFFPSLFLSWPIMAQTPPYIHADGSTSRDLSAARSSWQNDAEFNGNWGLKAIQADAAYAQSYTGKGSKIGIIDESVWIAHPEFSGPGKATFIPTYEALAKRGEAFVYDGEMYVDRHGNISDHGTHIAGIAAANRDGQGIQGVAYQANLVAADNRFLNLGHAVFRDNNGIYHVVKNVAWKAMIGHHVDIINNSWSFPVPVTTRKNWEIPTPNVGNWQYLEHYSRFLQVKAILGTPQAGAYDGAIAAAKSGIIVEFAVGNDFSADPNILNGLASFIPDIEKHWLTTMSVR